MAMSSHLVETMMINVEDFLDRFLTCGTCFTGYDNLAHTAKLLPCSHTVCQSCLERILETQAGEESFSCPICRVTIQITVTGGRASGSATAAAFPPAFIVNQLLDLLASQRRDRVPTCRLHVNQELLFCETCDVIFCPDCRGRGSASTGHQATQACGGSNVGISALLGNSASATTVPVGVGGAALSHNVISFSVAIKRCSEILLYKASLCVQELNSAQEAVTAELERLIDSSEACISAAESSFAEVKALVERRQAEVLSTIRRLGEEKRRALEDQLALIESERTLVQQQCDNLNNLLDVRSISKGISYLNDKLDTIESLTEPRENAFLRYQENTSPPRSSERSTTPSGSTSCLVDVARCLTAFGRISVSTTYPPLCTAKLPDEVYVHLPAKVTVCAFDYHGQPQKTGTDPIVVRFTDASGREAPSQCVDMEDGTYDLTILPITSEPHNLSVNILSRPIRGSPFYIPVRDRQKPRWSLSEGLDGLGFVQPFAVSVIPSNVFTRPRNLPFPNSTNEDRDLSISSSSFSLPEVADVETEQSVLLLDTGNSRIIIAEGDSGRVKSPACLVNEALKGQAATGMSYASQDGDGGLWVVNWRVNELMLLDLATNKVKQRISSPLFVEPTSVCVCPHTNRILVADNGAGCVFDCRPASSDGESATVTPLIGPQESSDCSSQLREKIAKNSSSLVHDGLHDALRRITGICITSTGEIILAAGPEICLYSSDGRYLGNLCSPLCGIQPSPTTVASSPDTLNFLSPFSQRTSTLPTAFNVGLNSAPGSTMTLSTDRRSTGMTRRPPSIRGSLRAPGVGGGYRGTFGGVTMSRIGRSQDSGEWLLATHTNRSRSVVVVWPECAWRAAISPESDLLVESAENFLGGPSLLRKALRQPYTLELDPAMRRLAGITVFPGSRFLVAVDLGGQCAYCIRYA